MNAAGAQQSITAVILRYGSALDARDRLGVLSCFTDDVHLSFFDGAVTAHGRAEAEAFFDFGTTDEQTVLVTRGLRYEDRLRGDAAGWRITHRRHVPLWKTRTPAERPDVG